jgi:hypothetical protein
MLRLGDNIRLTRDEKATLSKVAGGPVNPQTVADYNTVVTRAKAGLDDIAAHVEPELDADGVDHSGHAEAKLLGALADGLLIEP